LVSARQRSQGLAGIENLPGNRAGVELGGERGQRRGVAVPIIQRRLQRRGNTAGGDAAAQIGRENDKLPIGATIAKRGEFHILGRNLGVVWPCSATMGPV